MKRAPGIAPALIGSPIDHLTPVDIGRQAAPVKEGCKQRDDHLPRKSLGPGGDHLLTTNDDLASLCITNIKLSRPPLPEGPVWIGHPDLDDELIGSAANLNVGTLGLLKVGE